MTDTPLVSIIIPSYNHARFLKDCVLSVARQDYSQLELVVVDDRSPDQSRAVLEAICGRDDVQRAFGGRIQVEVNSQNVGAHDTINRGIGLSNGQLIGILNSDDMFAPGRLPEMIQAMNRERARLAFSNVNFVDERGSPIVNADAFVDRLRRRQSAIKRFPTVGFACLASNVAISTGNFLFERSLFDQVGPFRNLRYCHDWDFLLRCLLLTEPLYVPKTLYNYRVHGSNSFRSLENVAEAESAIVFQTFFDQVVVDRSVNRKAPSPQSWPGVFESFMSAYGLWPFWAGDKQEESQDRFRK